MKNKLNLNILQELKELLGDKYGRFSNYQKLPPCIFEKVGLNTFDYYIQSQISLDGPRYNWLKEQVNSNEMKVIEIGSNLGYFVLQLSTDFRANVEAYEPVIEYAKATELMAKLCNVDKNFTCNAFGILKKDLSLLNKCDLIINLNVLHHAGIEYDFEVLKKIGGWEKYAIDYLSLLSKKGKKLFFQTGNISSGESLFPMEKTIPYLDSLLNKAGWKTIAVGFIEDFNNIKYSTYNSDNLWKIPITECKRNNDTGLVDYFRNNKLCASLPTGLAARPLWYCESIQ